MTKVDEIRNLTKENLIKKLNSLYEELIKLNYQKRIGGLQNPHRFMLLRKEIARIKTVLREQELKQKTRKS